MYSEEKTQQENESEILEQPTQIAAEDTVSETEEPSLEPLTEPSLSESAEIPENAESTNSESTNASTTYALLQEFQTEYQKIESPEEKLKFCIHFMQKALGHEKTPSFKTFWDVRKICMELFKEEKIAPSLRTQFWTEFTHLTDEARRLKNLLDAESVFHMEQIDMAITKLETDIAALSQLAQNEPDLRLPDVDRCFEGDFDLYRQEQNQLNILNRFAVQINAMRKELIQVEMRIRHKNKFFQRLSKAGDVVFPQRKDLIKELSRHFTQDVEKFIDTHFQGKFLQPFFVLRETIKSLQSMAKILTLNTKAFTETRKKLSECWDKIRLLEKEKKQEMAEKKTLFQEKAQKIQEQIDLLKTEIVESSLVPDQIFKKLDEISAFMRREPLGREEVFSLKKELQGIRNQTQGILDAEREKRHSEEHARESQRQKKLETLTEAIQQLLSDGKTWTVVDIEAKKKTLLEEIESVAKNAAEKRVLKLQLEPLRDLIAERKEEALLSLSSDQRSNLENLRQVLEDRLQRRDEIKKHFEDCRKAAGASGLDFMQAMDANDRLKEARERLAKIDESIEEIEDKIREI